MSPSTPVSPTTARRSGGGERGVKDETAVVVGVVADEVHATGGEKVEIHSLFVINDFRRFCNYS